jgi:hypothetical protein
MSATFLLTGIGFFLIRNHSASKDQPSSASVTQSPSIEQTDTLNWLTLSNDSGKYSLKYPETWGSLSSEGSITMPLKYKDITLSIQIGNELGTINIVNAGFNSKDGLIPIDASEYYTYLMNPTKLADLTISGDQAVEISVETEDRKKYEIWYVVKANKTYYNLVFSSSQKQEIENELAVIDKIAKSFTLK